MRKLTLKHKGLVCASALLLPLYVASPIHAQNLPPEPDMPDLFGELAPPDDLEATFGDSELPALPDISSETAPQDAPLPAEIQPAPSVENAPANELPAAELEDDLAQDGLDPMDDFDDFDDEITQDLPLEESPINSDIATETSIDDSPTPESNVAEAEILGQTIPEYEILQEALFDFLGKTTATSSSNTETANEDTTEAPQIAEETLQAEAPITAEDELIDILDEEAPIMADEEEKAATEETLTTPVETTADEEVVAEATQPEKTQDTSTETQAEQAKTTEPAPNAELSKKKPSRPSLVENETKRPPLPALSAEEKAYIEEVDKKSKSLPGFAKLPDSEKKALQKPLEDLAREQKEADLKKSLPPENKTLERGQDLSALGQEDGSASSEIYDLTVSPEDKTDQFLSTDIQLEMAYRALLSGQLEAAIDIYKSVKEKHPDNQTALFGLASAYQKNNQYDKAKELYQQLLAASPNHKEALNNYLVLMTHEAPEDALLQLQKLEHVSPYYSPIPAQIGMVYYRTGQYIQAERYLRKAISMAPDNLSYLYNLAIISDHLGKTEQSIALYSRLLEENKKGKSIPGSSKHLTERLRYLRKKVN